MSGYHQAKSSRIQRNKISTTNHKGRSRTTKNARNGRKRKRGGYGQDIFVTPIKNQPIITRCMRYQFSQNVTSQVDVTNTDMLNYMVAVTTGSTVGIGLVSSIKINRVGVTMLPNDSAGTATCAFQWQGTNAPAEKYIQYAALGVPTKESYYPPQDSSAAWWYDYTSTANLPLFGLDVTSVTNTSPIYVDIDFSFVLGTGAEVVGSTVAISAVTGIGYSNLTTGNYLIPVGVLAV